MKKGIFIYHRGTRLARIARELSIPVYYPNINGGWIPIIRNRSAVLKTSVNWGSLRSFHSGVLNSNAINAAKKIKSFKLFNEHNISCPIWSPTWDGIKALAGDKQTIFARRDGLSGGAGIQIIKPSDRTDEINHDGVDFYTAKIPYHREYRLHVWMGETIIIQVKYLPPDCENPIHNHENGCKFSSQSVDKFLTKTKEKALSDLCSRAVEALSLDFGAVDIIQTPEGEFFVLEVNTAPGIKTDSVELAYRTALEKLIV